MPGGRLTVLAAGDVDSLDPGRTNYQFTYGLLSGVARPLYSFKPTDPGLHPSPDLAAGPPRISPDGRTVTVHLRQGVRYSPPYGRTVRAQDVKYAIERAFTPQVPNGYVNSYFNGIAGVAAFKHHRAADIRGIKTPDEHTIIFKLTGAGWGDLAGALTLPVTSPVPRLYARRFDVAEGQSTYARHVLATGPYLVSRYRAGLSIELARNPNWDPHRDFRPAYLDAIRVEEGNTETSVATQRIIHGRSLVSGDFAVPAEQLKRIVGSAKEKDLAINPGGGLRYVGVNATVAPFDRIDVRRALAAALDRQAMVAVRGGRFAGSVANHFLYPTYRGFDEAGGARGPGYRFYSSPRGNLTLARGYMKRAGYADGIYSGDRRVLMVASNTPDDRKDAEIAEDALKQLGFRVALREVETSTMYSKFCQVPRARVAICPSLGWVKDYPDPGTLIAPMFNPANIVPAGNLNFSQYRDAQLARQIADAARMPSGPARVAAWAVLDRRVTGLVLGVPYMWIDTAFAASPNVVLVGQAWNGGQPALDWTSIR